MIYGVEPGEPPTCLTCGNIVSIDPDLDWEQGDDVCNACAQGELTQLRADNTALIEALKQCRVYSECYDELIMTIDDALARVGALEKSSKG